MNNPKSLEEFESAIRTLAKSLLDLLNSQMEGKEWDKATLEARYAKDGSHWQDKIRVYTTKEGSISLDTTPQLTRSLISLNSLRKALGWYGFKLNIDKDHKVTVDYDYNADTIDDPEFYND